MAERDCISRQSVGWPQEQTRAEPAGSILPFDHPAPVARDREWSLVVATLQDIAQSLRRLADAHAPEPKGVVDTQYVAERLDCTAIYVAEMAREGKIPHGCVVPGTGNGKPWKFYREQIDGWVNSR